MVNQMFKQFRSEGSSKSYAERENYRLRSFQKRNHNTNAAGKIKSFSNFYRIIQTSLNYTKLGRLIESAFWSLSKHFLNFIF